MDEVTKGPIPSERMLPKLAPRMMDKISNRWSAFWPRPNKGTYPSAKNKTRQTPVHFSFSRNESFFDAGGATSGRFNMIFCKNGFIVLK